MNGYTLPAPAVPAFVFDVVGVPAPQGSKTAFLGFMPVGRLLTPELLKQMAASIRVTESSKKNKPWRRAVKAATVEAMAGRDPFDEPVAVAIEFVMPRPKAARKAAFWHTTYPDVDKLKRSTFDGLKEGGLVVDDARIVSGPVSKRYQPHEPAGRRTTPTGARISVFPLGDFEAAGMALEWAPTLVYTDTLAVWVPGESAA